MRPVYRITSQDPPSHQDQDYTYNGMPFRIHKYNTNDFRTKRIPTEAINRVKREVEAEKDRKRMKAETESANKYREAAALQNQIEEPEDARIIRLEQAELVRVLEVSRQEAEQVRLREEARILQAREIQSQQDAAFARALHLEESARILQEQEDWKLARAIESQ